MNDEAADYGLVQPFYIDDGELDGLTPQQVFVLGVEFAMIMNLLDGGEPFEKQFHAENEYRVSQMCERRGVEYRTEMDDSDWCILVVK